MQLVRELSSAAAMDGTATGTKLGAKFARKGKINARMISEERLAVAYRIFDRQACSDGPTLQNPY